MNAMSFRIVSQHSNGTSVILILFSAGRQPPGIEHADKWGEAMSLGYSGTGNMGENYWMNLIPAVGRKDIKIFGTPNEGKPKNAREED